MRALILLFSLTVLSIYSKAQPNPEQIYAENVHTVKLYPSGNQLAYPIIQLGSADKLELHFDDLDADIKNYYYTFQLCNADWTPAQLNTLDFIQGFTQSRINTYRNSSIALTRYTHYQLEFPERNMQPTRSGNYILKVFLNGDTSQLIFTKRFLVVQPVATIGAQIQQPYNSQLSRSHQKVNFTVNLGAMRVPIPQQQIMAYILQNNRWDNAIKELKPTFVRVNSLEYNTEQQAVFQAGVEWRWLDLRSFRLQSDRIAKANYKPAATEMILQPDPERRDIRSIYYRDNNGLYSIETLESLNPFWQGDYATVVFRYFPKQPTAYNNKKVVLFGELSGYGSLPGSEMTYIESEGYYETSLFLKQGYYDYAYMLQDAAGPNTTLDGSTTEGNNWETENTYTILIYYRPFGARADELIGVNKISSFQGRR